ncbi:MAG: CRISPR-associated protein Cas4 [Candidatus Omnitrophica bacterium]|nr:CRISPR-associated protein Cas4 [Candidatus Omnitrophota bacterium]
MAATAFSEDELLYLSALQHLVFCERQCALIHLEGQWNENYLTALGRVMHEKKVDQPAQESRGDLKIEYGMPLRSLRLGLSGKADAVEFHRQPDGSWLPFPVEHKLGKPKIDDSDRIQLCAQAICFEEMLSVQVPRGALFYGRPRRREEVAFDEALRQKTQETAGRLHALIKAGITPIAVYEKKCDACSLVDLCLPKLANRSKSVHSYLREIMGS